MPDKNFIRALNIEPRAYHADSSSGGGSPIIPRDTKEPNLPNPGAFIQIIWNISLVGPLCLDFLTLL